MSVMERKLSPDGFLDTAWSNTVDGFEWLKSVLLGEFADNRSLSSIVAEMLLNFLPGVVIVTSARDAIAVILRMAQHPEKREELMEWVLLSACLIALAVPIVMAAGGAVFAGVGAIVGAAAGSELGAILRGVMLMLIKKSGKLIEMIQFLQKFVRGDLVRFLRAIRFVEYEKSLLMVLNKTVNKLVEICQALRRRLEMFKYFDDVKHAIAKLAEWEHKFYAVQAQAVKKIPLAMAELQVRLNKLLAEVLPREAHLVSAGVSAERPAAQAIKVQHVHDVAGRPLLSEGKGAKDGGSHASAPARSPESAGNGERKLTPDKIEIVPETPNTKRQQTHEPEVPHVPAGAFTYPRDLSTRVAEEAHAVIRSGSDTGPAIARVGSHGLGLESPAFFNFSKKELGAKTPAFPGVLVADKGAETFVVSDVEQYMNAMIEVYKSVGEAIHPRTIEAIRARIANRVHLPMKDGLPGAHAEVRAQNWFYNKSGGLADGETTAATYKLLGVGVGEQFVACSNCSRIIPTVVNVVTGRRY